MTPWKLLKKCHPKIFKEIHPTLNRGIDINNLGCSSAQTLMWQCPDDPCGHHVYPAKVRDRVYSKNKCSFCAHKRVCICDSIYTLKPKLMKLWDWKRNKKIGLNPKKLSVGSGEKAYWRCKKRHKKGCRHHKWRARIYKMSKSGKCTYCIGRRTCECDSFYSKHPDLMKQWDWKRNDKKGLDPKKLAHRSNKYAYWKCDKAKCKHHKWKARIADRTHGYGCPFCAGNKTCPCLSFMTLFPHLAEEYDWDKNGDIDPYKISKGSHRKIWWKDKYGHSWKAVVHSRTRNIGCPICCKSQLEKKCAEILERLSKIYNITLDEQIRFDNYRNPDTGRKLPFDSTIYGFNRVANIELDGIQHFEPICFDGKTNELKRICKCDRVKTNFCMDTDKYLLRLSYAQIEYMEEHLVSFFERIRIVEADNEEVFLMLCGREYFN